MVDKSGLEEVFDGITRSLATPCVVVDGSGRLVSFNQPAIDLFGIKESNNTFADLFLISEGVKVKSFLSSPESIVFGDPVNLFLRNGKEISVSFTKTGIDLEGGSYFCFHVKEAFIRDSERLKVRLSSRESADLGLSEGLAVLINEIESSYPFTYITKTRIQSSANNLDEMVWMKDNEGKYVFVNDKYSSFLNLKPGQMEGRSEKNFIPQFVHEFNHSLDKYLRDSNAVASMISRRVAGVPVDRPYQIVTIPLLDIDDNLVAVLGIARPHDEETVKSETVSENNLIFNDVNNFNLETVLKLKNKMYEFIVSKNPDAVFVYDLKSFRFLDVNDAALAIYGYNRNEFLQMDLTDLYLPDEIQTIADSAKNEEGKFVGPFNHRKKDGTLIQVEICKISFNYEGDEAHFNIVRDITGLLEKEEQLQMMRTVFEHSRDILVVTDNTGFINYVNPAVEEHLGFKRSDLLSNSIVSLTTESSRADFLKKSITPVSFPADIKKKSGETVAAEVTSIAFQGIDGEINQIAYIGKLSQVQIQPKEVIIEKPVEKIVYVEKPVEKIVYVEKQIQGNHEIKAGGIDPGQLSYIFHEILTPINVIVGFIAELKDSIPSPTTEQEEAMDFIDENRKKLLFTMDSISEYAQIEQHFAEINKTGFALDHLIERVIKEANDTQNTWRKPTYADRKTPGLMVDSDEEKVTNLVLLLIKIMAHITDEKELIISGYQIDEGHFIITFRDHNLKIQQKLLYLIQNIFVDSDVSKLRAFGVSRFTIFSAQRLYKLLKGNFEIIQRSGTPYEIGLVLPIDGEFDTQDSKATDGKDRIFKPAIVADKISVEKERPASPTETYSTGSVAAPPAYSQPEARQQKLPEYEKSDYTDFDFDSELDFLNRRRRRETEVPNERQASRTFEDDHSKDDRYTPAAKKRDLFESGSSTGDKSFRRTYEDIPARTPAPPPVQEPVRRTPPPTEERIPERAAPVKPEPSYVETRQPQQPTPVQRSAEPKEGALVDLSKLNCLYIEDQLDSQILFKVQMKELKSIKFSQSFEDAVPLLESEKFDFIVLDINLQGEYNGLDALKIIRTMDGLEETPIIAVTAYVLPGDKEKFIATGFNDFVSKPIFRNKMVEVLGKIF